MPEKIKKLKEINLVLEEAIAKLETRAFLLNINNAGKIVSLSTSKNGDNKKR
jgi:hypothetical protein